MYLPHLTAGAESGSMEFVYSDWRIFGLSKLELKIINLRGLDKYPCAGLGLTVVNRIAKRTMVLRYIIFFFIID